jgi:hypothetical protein
LQLPGIFYASNAIIATSLLVDQFPQEEAPGVVLQPDGAFGELPETNKPLRELLGNRKPNSELSETKKPF